MTNIKGKTVFISGASSGIGMACAEYFAKAGCNLILIARRKELIKELGLNLKEKYSVEVLIHKLDIRERELVLRFIDDLPIEWKNIDILINNAGGAYGMDKFQDGDIDDWEIMIDSNVKGLLYLTRKIVPLMIDNKDIDGHIINIGSIAGVAAYPNGAVYCAAKAAVKMISDGLRIDTVDKPIRVTNIQPGLVETNFSIVRFHGDKDKADKVYQGLDVLTAEDIADLVLYTAQVPKHVQICEVTVTPTNQASGPIVFRNG